MSRHEGVSCDSCLKGNFRGKRYKCLICYDYDLCATCYEAGATTTRHTTEHAMQCILTRSDFELYYGGEAISVEQPQSFTCPFCGKMGFTEATLQEHVTAEHSETTFEVVCPICAALPGGEPNNVTDDFAAHLTLEHRNPRDMDEPSGSRHVRRIPHPGRGMSSTRAARRSQMQFSSSSGISSLSPSSRETMDPIAELLSQLSGVRRTGTLPQPSTTSQLHQLQMQLQLERQQAQAARQQLERLPRRQTQVSGTTPASSAGGGAATAAGNAQSQYTVLLEPLPSPASNTASQFLLSRFTEPTLTEAEQQALETERSDRSLFVQELILSTLTEELSLCDDWDSISKKIALVDESSSSSSAPGACKDDSSCCSSPSSACAPPRSGPFLPQQQQSSGKVRKLPNSTSAVRQQQGGGRGQSTQAANRGGVSQRGNRGQQQLNRAGNGASPSSTRRKVPRQVDDRNKSSEPPPPH